MTKEPFLCINCRAKECEKKEDGTFSSCDYGIAFLKRFDEVEKIEPLLPVSKISRNLRHEINPVLQVIVENAAKIDSSLSTKKIYLDNPLSIIVGATVVLDIFIQMISGVNEFHSSHEPVNINKRKITLRNAVDFYFSIYSIIKERHKTNNLNLENQIPEDIEISICSDFILYSIAVLIDNAWKHSIDNSTISVESERREGNRINISFTNISKEIPEGSALFDLGVKVNKETKGFGFGLFWAKTLEFHYNKLTNQEESEDGAFRLTHQQKKINGNGTAYQLFKLQNILL